ncbi:MAG: alpha-glucosidase, partial [Pseudomonadota bacterium]
PILVVRRTRADQQLLCVFNLGADAARFVAPMALESLPGHGFQSDIQGGVITLPGYGAFFGTIRSQYGA